MGQPSENEPMRVKQVRKCRDSAYLREMIIFVSLHPKSLICFLHLSILTYRSPVPAVSDLATFVPTFRVACVCLYVNMGWLAVTLPLHPVPLQEPSGPYLTTSEDFNVTLPRLAVHSAPSGLERDPAHAESPVVRCGGSVWVV